MKGKRGRRRRRKRGSKDWYRQVMYTVYIMDLLYSVTNGLTKAREHGTLPQLFPLAGGNSGKKKVKLLNRKRIHDDI